MAELVDFQALNSLIAMSELHGFVGLNFADFFAKFHRLEVVHDFKD